MRIAFLVGQYPAWSEQFLQRDVLALEARGHEIAIWPCQEALHGGSARWTLPSGRPLPPVLGQASKVDHRSILQALNRCGLLQMRRWVNVLRAQALLPWRPDCIVAGFADLPAVIGYALSKSLSLPFGGMTHARDIWVPWHPGHRALQQAGLVTVCNTAAHQQLRTLYPALHDRIHLVHHALPSIGPSATAPQSTVLLDIIAAGRFVPKKGFEVLLQAFAQFRETHSEARLLLIGEGPLDRTYRRIRQRFGLQKHVQILERHSPEALHSKMRQASAIAVPSVIASDGDRDGIPNIMLEAMALGIPVVGSDIGGLPEVLSKETGWPVPTGDPVALSQALSAAVIESESTVLRTQKARLLVADQFAVEHTTPKLEACFLELCNSI